MGESGYAVSVEARSHTIRADEPEELGGTDTGATPIEMLLASLATCTLITIRMYASRKGWALDGAEASVTGRRDAPGPGGLSTIEMQLRFIGELDDEQRTRLLQIADACPVHKTLKSGVTMQTLATE